MKYILLLGMLSLTPGGGGAYPPDMYGLTTKHSWSFYFMPHGF